LSFRGALEKWLIWVCLIHTGRSYPPPPWNCIFSPRRGLSKSPLKVHSLLSWGHGLNGGALPWQVQCAGVNQSPVLKIVYSLGTNPTVKRWGCQISQLSDTW
jgi:hypothetical protein